MVVGGVSGEGADGRGCEKQLEGVGHLSWEQLWRRHVESFRRFFK